MNKELAQEILYQMGGIGRLKMFVNARNFKYGNIQYDGFEMPFVQFDFSMSKAYKTFRVIYYEGRDLYVVQFLDSKNQVVKEVEDVYADMLVELFENTTGLFLYF